MTEPEDMARTNPYLANESCEMSTQPIVDGRLALFSKDFRMIASAMEVQTIDPLARIRYHFLADGIVWTDEVLPGEGENALRSVLHYRTALIMNEAAEASRPYWDYAKRQFPNWIGFSADRCSADRRLQRIIRYFRFRSNKAIDTCEADYEGTD